MRLRLLAAFGLAFGVFTAVSAQDKKEPAKPAETKKAPEGKKDEGKKAEPPPPAVSANPLATKFDKPFFQELTTKTIQNIKVQGLDVGQSQEQTFYFKFEPVKQDGDKWLVRQTIEGVKMKIDIAGNPVSFDSTNEAAAAGSNTALSEFFKALKGSQFTLTIAKDGTVEKIDGREDFVKKLINANKQLESLLNKILSEEAMKQMADPSFGVTPKEVKKEGDKWTRTVQLPLGPLGSYKNNYNFTFKKQTGDVAELDVAVDLAYAPPGADQAGEALPFKIKEGKIEQMKDEKSNKGTVRFNTKTGRIDSSAVTVKMTGNLKLEIGGSVTDVGLTQEQTTEIKSQDKSFVPERKS